MRPSGPLGHVEFTVLEAVHRGALRARCTVQHVSSLRGEPAGEVILHDVLRRCEQDGLLRSGRDGSGRRYELTAAGRARLRADHKFRAALIRTLLRGASRAHRASRH